jgi:D-alanyl-D-alanine-carboxypeptidase/D-alanyl-D-alanine-endopeptidase
MLAAALLLASAPAAAAPLPADVAARIDRAMMDAAQQRHWPGIAWGIVRRGEGLVHAGHHGLADAASRRPVTSTTRFRIASMTKAFTALTIEQLAAEGRLRLDDKVVTHVPEVEGWGDHLTITDLLHHMGGFVTDDPWGDRQTPLPEAEFTSLLKAGVPFTRATGLTHEYSNLGYAMLGRIISNVSGRPFEAEIARRHFRPLGMGATSFNLADVPAAEMATGWRQEDGIFKREPDMGPGAFGAMGGVITNVPDYARWVDHLLSAWPAASPGTAEAPARATIRRLGRGEGSPRRMNRPGDQSPSPCAVAVVYGGGLRIGDDCTLGRVAFHGGGYPGYGSHMIIAPDRGWGVFVFTNHTYAGPSDLAWAAMLAIEQAGLMPVDAIAASPAIRTAAAFAETALASGTVAGNQALHAVNLLQDRDASHRAADIAAVKAQAGPCAPDPRLVPSGALEATLSWQCQNGTISAYLLLAPTPDVRLQALDWRFQADAVH